MWVEAKMCLFDFTSLLVKWRLGVAVPFVSGFSNLKFAYVATLHFKPVNPSMYTHEINQWQLMMGKWDLQTQAGAPEELRWVEMAGSA